MLNDVRAAIEVERGDGSVAFPARHDLRRPRELTALLDSDRKLREAFHALTPGRQRSHVLHIDAAKGEETRVARVERSVRPILAGRGRDGR